uniref:Uncharacterized protein n=1 Tax=Arundo donax TaxID=35708 RepID=A0A0A8Z5I1_ARUDO
MPGYKWQGSIQTIKLWS